MNEVKEEENTFFEMNKNFEYYLGFEFLDMKLTPWQK